MMQYNRLGKTDLRLSAVGFGTCQLRLVPKRQAIETLKRGFELGVNWVHTAPDYGGAEPLIARAISESGRDVTVFCNGFGEMRHFEHLFETTCRTFGKERLEVYGISCIDDHELIGHPVWEPNGMIDFLVQRKEEGRIGSLFCTTHGSPEYVSRLITCGLFDAVMLSYNPLGFHVLSYFGQAEGKEFERIDENRQKIFPLALKHDVGLLVMKPLAGGMLSPSKAFPAHERFSEETEPLKARDILRFILREPAVCAVAPGTASIEEAEENARAGHAPIDLTEERVNAIENTVAVMKTSLCSRCGDCEPTCSKQLPISWLFREAYIWNYPSDTFEALGRLHYFKLHPEDEPTCAACTEKTCVCPHGLDIPPLLTRVHARMVALREEGLIHATPAELAEQSIDGPLAVKVIWRDVPGTLDGGTSGLCRFWLENSGNTFWRSSSHTNGESAVALAVFIDNRFCFNTPLRHDVPPDTRVHLAFEIEAPKQNGNHDLRFSLVSLSNNKKRGDETTILKTSFLVEKGVSKMGWTRFFRRKQKPVTAMDTMVEKAAPEKIYGAHYGEHNIPAELKAGQVYAAKVVLENRGDSNWHSNPPEGNSTDLAVWIDGQVVATHKLPAESTAPGKRVTVHFPMKAPSDPGHYRIELDLVEQKVTRFQDRGIEPLTIDVAVVPGVETGSASLFDEASRVNPWFYQPTRGIVQSESGCAYPVFISRSKGSRMWDPEGHEYIDYIMGWGSTLLGYADEAVQNALRETIGETGPTLPLPHPYEIEVAKMLAEDFPSAEMAIFGKNGSDACTVAARVARVVTGRQYILYCGYHGWQDFWAEQHGFARSGIPDRSEKLIYNFKFNDLDDFHRLYNRGKDVLAAVFIEPSGPWGGNDVGFEPDVDRTFLKTIAAAAREAGALLIFDEIVTGYRYPGGSVQKATGVVPDLTCLGKALASGMPLSAVAGRAEVLRQGMARIFYGPTFKSEIYSLAAARAAIARYREEPVAQYVWDYGLKLKEGIENLCSMHGICAGMTGPPFRMSLIFEEQDHHLRNKMRTLYMQEMLRQGVITYNGVMLPSYSHDDSDLERTLSAVDHALGKIAEAQDLDDFDRFLELPPLLDL